jgi:predicted RNA-binding protein with PUA-like domain
MNYWLLKTEPGDFSYMDLQRAGVEDWDGVRNAKAQKHLRQMQPGDLTFIYHTGGEKAIVGVAQIESTAFPDPTDTAYSAIRVRALYALQNRVTLKEIKADPQFAGWELVRLPRLSLMPVPASHWRAILSLTGTAGLSKLSSEFTAF